MFKQLSKQYLLCLKMYVQTNNSAHNIHSVSLKYTFNTNTGMSSIDLLPTWLVPEARWQGTGILSCRPVHRRARVNTVAKNKYLFQEYSPQPLAVRGKKINCNKTDKLLIFNVVYARPLNIRTTHTHTYTHAALGFRRVGEKQPFTSHYKPQHTSLPKNLLLTFTFTNSTPSPH